MDPGTTEGYRMMESGADAWAVEGDARRGLPESREIGAEYEAMATSTAPVNPSGSKTAEGKAARHTAFDPPNEVSPGVLSDGRWTGEHPLVRGYINEVTSQHGSSLNPDLLVASTLPFDLRIYALVALSVQDMAESPVFWLLYNANQKDRTRAVIQDQIQSVFLVLHLHPDIVE
ncbi:hypothetical protein OE88DRAFT_1146039 [Heliocybe sulcata]|uniref:Uncharacterized protein n=1 Tax=Heliocybe sulcata TaxID=5364 RepID=A0A5C3N9Y3_9AGAM|nr:hypothetical protein OE88DRAFT_1146039 [Heliocybe sulcata]